MMAATLYAHRKFNDDDDADGDGGELGATAVVSWCVCCCGCWYTSPVIFCIRSIMQTSPCASSRLARAEVAAPCSYKPIKLHSRRPTLTCSRPTRMVARWWLVVVILLIVRRGQQGAEFIIVWETNLTTNDLHGLLEQYPCRKPRPIGNVYELKCAPHSLEWAVGHCLRARMHVYGVSPRSLSGQSYKTLTTVYLK